MEYGSHLRSEWLLDESIAYLNHGTVGAPPRPVLAERRRLLDEIERQPAQFLLRELADTDGSGTPRSPRMREAAARVARFVGCDSDSLGFVDNATAGVNAVLRSFPFTGDDEILYTTLGYGGVNNTVEFVATHTGARPRAIELPPPGAPATDYVDAVERALTGRSRMLVIDHITSPTSIVLPLREIAEVCRRAGVYVLADGAHAPGAVDLHVESLGVDWYAGNLHKWAFAPRSSGFLWASPRHHDTLHPTVISWGWRHGIAAEFDLLGTRDPTPWLVSAFALDLFEEWGGSSIMAHNHSVVARQAARLSHEWGTEFATPPDLIGPMVYLDLPPQLGATRAEAIALQASLLDDDLVELPIFADGGRLTCRVSAQIYNDDADFDRLSQAVLRRVNAR